MKNSKPLNFGNCLPLGVLLIFLFFYSAPISAQFFFSNPTPVIAGKNVRINIFRASNNCWLGSNPAHDWLIYINGEFRYRTGLGGANQQTITLPLKDKDFGGPLKVKAEIYENKCVGSGMRYVYTYNFHTIDVPPLSGSDFSNLMKYSYYFNINGTDLGCFVSSSRNIRTTSDISRKSRFAFEPTGTRGVFYIQVAENCQYLRVDNTHIITADRPHDTKSRFELEYSGGGLFKIRHEDKYLFSDANRNILVGKPSSHDKSFFNFDQAYRSVSFVATGDPQFQIMKMNKSHKRYNQAKAVLDRFAELTYGTDFDEFHGVIISGDMTQSTKMGEFRKYKKLTEDYRDFLFDGLGNHDLNNKTSNFVYRDFLSS